MAGEVRVHKGFEVGAPPLGERVADVPVGVGGGRVDGGEALIQAVFEARDLFSIGGEIVAWSDRGRLVSFLGRRTEFNPFRIVHTT